jgi:hypothetical protein
MGGADPSLDDEVLMTGRPRWFFPALTCAAIGLSAAGCSGGDGLPRQPVSGTVTLDNEPLAEGTIQFSPQGEAAVGGGSVIEGGRFSIPRESGLVPGTYAVAVYAGQKKAEQAKGRVVARSGLAKEMIPARFNAQTTLKAEIKEGGSSDLKFDLQSK